MATLKFTTDYCGVGCEIKAEVNCRLNYFGTYYGAQIIVTEVESVRIGGIDFAPCEDSVAEKHWREIAQDRIDGDDDLQVEAGRKVESEAKEPRYEEANR